MLARIKAITSDLRVKTYKRRAKQAYVQYLNLLDSVDCGAHMGEVVHGHRRETLAVEFNRCIDALQRLGQPVPPMRLPTRQLSAQIHRTTQSPTKGNNV